MVILESVRRRDENLVITLNRHDIFKCSFINQQLLDRVKYAYDNNIISFISSIDNEIDILISPQSEDYNALCEMLEYYSYDLTQARTIISWIEEEFVGVGCDAEDWGSVYCHILKEAMV